MKKKKNPRAEFYEEIAKLHPDISCHELKRELNADLRGEASLFARLRSNNKSLGFSINSVDQSEKGDRVSYKLNGKDFHLLVKTMGDEIRKKAKKPNS